MKELSYIFPHLPTGLSYDELNPATIPVHVAVIMDGNGRWANARGKSRLSGHRAGINAVRETIRTASDIGIKYLTVYAFSSENWKRDKKEVSGLMELFAKTTLAEVEELHKEQVRIKVIGDMTLLPPNTRSAFEAAQEKTKNNTGLTILMAVNYGGRDEILQAVNASRNQAYQEGFAEALRLVSSSSDSAHLNIDSYLPHQLSASDFSSYFYTAGVPDPDLLIRTSGEMRLSNFLLWQIAYTEIYCTPVLWPDFDRYEFLRALLSYQGRSRRFGGAKDKPQIQSNEQESLSTIQNQTALIQIPSDGSDSSSESNPS